MTANITKTLQEEKEQAVKEKVLEVAKNLLNMGLYIEQVIKATGLTKEDIEGLE